MKRVLEFLINREIRPSINIEPAIAAGIVFVALQNVFWPESSRGRNRLAVAFFFGLFHGMGFAGGLLVIPHQRPQESAPFNLHS
jgi:diadenosine tetraphosphatase ApaH/serine/threonine PP2A family protein phosphatase